MKILKIGEKVTVVTPDGTIITTTKCSEELFQEVHRLSMDNDLEAIKKLLVPELSKQEHEFVVKRDLVMNIETLITDYPNLFKKVGTVIYRKGIELSIPEDLAINYVKIYQNYKRSSILTSFEETDEFKALDNFWMWCALNPNAESREDLFKFLKTHGMPITNQGMFLAYRRVDTVADDNNKEYISFISNSYLKVKGTWKKNPAHYHVCRETNKNIFRLSTSYVPESIGLLSTLYDNLHETVSSQFTDNHTGTMDYRIGVEARMPRHEGNQSNQVSCSKGLHVASKAYDYSGFGDTAILVVVNPMDVLAVPKGEDGKLRTCALTPLAVLEVDEENNILDSKDFEANELLVNHFRDQVDSLQELLNNSTLYELNINHILGVSSQNDMYTIINNLSRAEDIVKSRIINI